MKNLSKRTLAMLLTLLMAAALLPVTVSAQFCAIILLETKTQYTVEELEVLLPEIEMASCHHLGGGTLFEIYFGAESDEEAAAAANMLNANPIVKKAEYCKITYSDYDPSQAAFLVEFKDGFAPILEDDFVYTPELGKVFPEIEIINAEEYLGGYRIECAAETLEALDRVYEILTSNPFVSAVYLCDKGSYGTYHPIGGVTVHISGAHEPEELQALFPEIEIADAEDLYGEYQYKLRFNATTIKETVEAIARVKGNPNVAYLYWTAGGGGPAVGGSELEECYYKAPERSDVTVATALSALRIAANLAEAKNGVYDYKLADAIWQYDLDGDKEITVSDALRLLRIAAKLA